MSIKENLKSIVNELDTNTLSIDYEAFNNLTDQITHAKRIFLCGKGRSGLAISAFANRLMHLGLDVALDTVSNPSLMLEFFTVSNSSSLISW